MLLQFGNISVCRWRQIFKHMLTQYDTVFFLQQIKWAKNTFIMIHIFLKIVLLSYRIFAWWNNIIIISW